MRGWDRYVPTLLQFVTRHLPLIFWWQSLRDLKRHLLMGALNVLSIALGIAVYLAIQIANGSANKAFEAAVDVVAGKAHLEIRGSVDEDLWPRIAKHPGVKHATATVEGIATLPDHPGEYLRLLGVDSFSSGPFLTFALTRDRPSFDFEQWLGRPGQVALSQTMAERLKVREGATIRALVNGESKELTVVSILDTRDTPEGSDSRIAAIDIGWAQELLGTPGKLTSLLLLLDRPGDAENVAAELNKVLPQDLRAEAPRQRSGQLQRMVSAFQLNLTALSMVSLLVGVFLVYNTVSATVTRRRREVGILRAVGATRNEVRALFLGEAPVYGAAGIVLGCMAGVGLAPLLAGAVERTISSLYVLVTIGEVRATPLQFATAAIFGILAVLVGAWLPANEAARVNPIRALSLAEHATFERFETFRFGWYAAMAAAFAVLLGAAALYIGPPALAFVAAFLVLLAWALISPAAVRRFGHHVRGLLPASVLWTLSADRFVRALRRNAITVAALSAAVGMMVALTVMIDSFRRTVTAWIDSVVVADLVIAPSSNEIIGLNATIPPSAIEWLRAQPDVAAVDTFWEERIAIGSRGESPKDGTVSVYEGPFRGNLPLRSGNPARAGELFEEGKAVLVSEPFARKRNVRVGDELSIQSPAGLITKSIAAVYADYGRDEGVVLMNRGLFDRHWPGRGIHSIAIYTAGNAPVGEVAERFRTRWSSAGEYSIYSNRQLRERVLTIFEQTFAVTGLLRIVAVAVAVIGIFLSISTLVLERERETGTLRAIGASRTQIVALTMYEGIFVGAVASALGMASGCSLAILLTHVVNPAFFGWTIQLYWPIAVLAATPVWIIAAAAAAAFLPARRAAAVNIAEAVREE